MSFTALSLPELLGRIAANEPVPGGGSAAAIAGAMAAALTEMVGRLTIGKKNYEAVALEATTLAMASEHLVKVLTVLAEADAGAFHRVMEAMALPKATDDEKAARSAAIQAATIGATEPPMAVAEACLEAARLAARLLEVGNKNAASDAAVAVLLAVAGAEGALLNVAINLASIKDAETAARVKAQADALWVAAAARRADLWPAVATAGLVVPR